MSRGAPTKQLKHLRSRTEDELSHIKEFCDIFNRRKNIFLSVLLLTINNWVLQELNLVRLSNTHWQKTKKKKTVLMLFSQGTWSLAGWLNIGVPGRCHIKNQILVFAAIIWIANLHLDCQFANASRKKSVITKIY